MSRLADIPSLRASAEIFRLLFTGTGEELHVRKIEYRSGLNDSTIRQELRKLVRLDLIQSRRDSSRVYYRIGGIVGLTVLEASKRDGRR